MATKNDQSVMQATNNASGVYPLEITSAYSGDDIFQGFIAKEDTGITSFSKLDDSPAVCTDVTTWAVDGGAVIPLTGKNMVISSGSLILMLRSPYDLVQ